MWKQGVLGHMIWYRGGTVVGQSVGILPKTEGPAVS
jgi:hypothetical protein